MFLKWEEDAHSRVGILETVLLTLQASTVVSIRISTLSSQLTQGLQSDSRVSSQEGQELKLNFGGIPLRSRLPCRLSQQSGSVGFPSPTVIKNFDVKSSTLEEAPRPH